MQKVNLHKVFVLNNQSEKTFNIVCQFIGDVKFGKIPVKNGYFIEGSDVTYFEEGIIKLEDGDRLFIDDCIVYTYNPAKDMATMFNTLNSIFDNAIKTIQNKEEKQRLAELKKEADKVQAYLDKMLKKAKKYHLDEEVLDNYLKLKIEYPNYSERKLWELAYSMF